MTPPEREADPDAGGSARREAHGLRRVARESTNPNLRLYAERRLARLEGRVRAEGRDVASEPMAAPAGQQDVRRMAEHGRQREAGAPGPGGPSELQRRAEHLEADAGTPRPRDAEREFAAETRARGSTPPGGQPGVSAVVTAVEDVEFPTTREDLVATRGDRPVEIKEGVKPPLREVLRKAGGGRFESLDDLKSTLHANWDAVQTLTRDR